MKKHYTVAISKGLTIAFGLVLLGSLYFVPYMTGYLDTIFTESSLGWPFTVTVYCCAAVGFGILVFLYRLLCRLDRNVVFVRENANSIRNISICLFLISGICTGVFGCLPENFGSRLRRCFSVSVSRCCYACVIQRVPHRSRDERRAGLHDIGDGIWRL